MLPILALARIAFIPLFLLCNVQPRGHLPVVFNDDVVPIVLVWLFALSNGYLGTLCMMYGPRLVFYHMRDLKTDHQLQLVNIGQHG